MDPRQLKKDGRIVSTLWDFTNFEPVYGQAQGQHLDTPLPYALLPFIFSLKPIDATHLRFLATDFHSNTWHATRTVQQLEELKAEVEMAGSMREFLAYFREAFSSENVKISLGGASSAVGGHVVFVGANSAKAVAQKTKASIKISVPLTKFGGPSAKDAMGFIVQDLYLAFRSQSIALSAERKRATALSTALALERENGESFQEDFETTYTSKRRKLSSSQFASTSSQTTVQTTAAADLSLSVSPQAPAGERVPEEVPATRHYVRLSASSRKAKQKERGQVPDGGNV